MYQILLSPIMSHRCRYYPSCSSYARQALAEFGILSGLWLSIARILRCNQLFSGGFDPIPTKKR